ncbi:hypothetical protein BCF55_0387 [Hydrogenivirga caldilitoris]|uniref:Uncharacterized protein n=1 Tax=Hydrogenivirga caldilitoris TaxID=246264 RepID=A0A497XT82_9AQUI|nr:hypothetical protein BCF55_0387 [Hydrogenivirga caldilitoris]
MSFDFLVSISSLVTFIMGIFIVGFIALYPQRKHILR